MINHPPKLEELLVLGEGLKARTVIESLFSGQEINLIKLTTEFKGDYLCVKPLFLKVVETFTITKPVIPETHFTIRNWGDLVINSLYPNAELDKDQKLEVLISFDPETEVTSIKVESSCLAHTAPC